MAAQKQSWSKYGRAKQAAPATGHLPIVLSTAACGVLNMTATAVTSGSVLLRLFAAKRLL
jgi:hypothetical protein